MDVVIKIRNQPLNNNKQATTSPHNPLFATSGTQIPASHTQYNYSLYGTNLTLGMTKL